ncbi:HTTM domain-containing protein [Mycolicibacterium flavescens]|uniref:HTTM domain-containing protein n=1 Tax=Mycolicibacterium flavescens TaxID=1776 RepID=UPI000A59B497|nr:HTTM domain-containing protein [Mycolicibacterium flavescens]
MNLKTAVRDRAGRAVNAWQSFWFGNQPGYTLGIVRMVFGLLMIGWTMLLASDLNVAFGADGVVPRPPSRTFTWGIFHVYASDSAILVGWLVLLVASIALTVGWHSRIAAIVVFVLIMSFERRNPVIFNSGDTVIRITALYLALAPCGAGLSLDQRRRSGSFFSARQIRPWALRLIQIQVTIIYVTTVIHKLAGETWQNGTAVGYSLRQHDLLILPTPEWLSTNLLISNVLTWGTLALELAIGILVWKRSWRPWVLAGGVILHLSISLFLEVGFFSMSMFVLYLAFIPPERAQALAEGAQARLVRLKNRILSRLPGDDEDLFEEELRHENREPDEDSAPQAQRAPQRPLRVKLPTEIFVDRGGDPRQQRIIEAGRARNGNGHTDISSPIPGGHRNADALSIAVPIPEAGSDAPTGRHARRNGSLTGHTN